MRRRGRAQLCVECKSVRPSAGTDRCRDCRNSDELLPPPVTTRSYKSRLDLGSDVRGVSRCRGCATDYLWIERDCGFCGPCRMEYGRQNTRRRQRVTTR